jgi:SAM-dependent methyltransferase
LIEQQIKQFNGLNEWFHSALGLSVADEFRKQLVPVLDYLKGDSLVQLGPCADNLWLDSLSYNNKWIASPFNTEDKSTLVCSLSQIPLQRNSLDCVIAPLTIEPFDNHLNVFDEIDRILKPMGYVVFLCVNPWSLWGGALKAGLTQCYSDGKLNMLTPFHLNRLFIQRGYRQCSLNNFYYIPPVTNHALLKKMAFFNEVGKMLWPFPSGFYCYIAQKHTPIAPSLTLQAVMCSISDDYVSALQALN